MRFLLPILLAACTGTEDPPTETDAPATVVDTDDTAIPEPPIVDPDLDGIDASEDNCPDEPNPDQLDQDDDGEGDLCDPDLDGDLIPNDFDLFPANPDRPGRAINEFVYPHTASEIYTFNVNDYEIELVGAPGIGTMTDLAIDRHGVMWVMTFTELWICHPQTAECWLRGSLPTSGNGLTFVPQGVLEPDRDSLVAISSSGAWGLVTENPGGQATVASFGGYGPGYTSSGDAFSIVGVGTFAAVTTGGGDAIVAVDPANGSVQSTLATFPAASIWGLAGWQDAIYAFSASGGVTLFDPLTGDASSVGNYPVSWYGAGVQTEIPEP